MEYRAFTEGVRPGSVTTSHEIIILLCYIIGKAGQPVTVDELNLALQQEALVNYFELMSAWEYLLRSDHLRQEGSGYVLSPLGEQTAAAFEGQLPVAVKERATRALTQVIQQLRRQRENQVQIEKTSDGYQITMTITDICTDLLSLRMFMPGREECEAIRRRFLEDPAAVYRGVFTLFTGDKLENGETKDKE